MKHRRACMNILWVFFFSLLSLSKGWRFVLYEWEDSGVIMTQSQTGGQSCGNGPSLHICSRQRWLFFFFFFDHCPEFKTVANVTFPNHKVLLLFGWHGDKFFELVLYLSPFLTSVVSFCICGNPVDGCFLLKAGQSGKLLLLQKDAWRWLSLQKKPLIDTDFWGNYWCWTICECCLSVLFELIADQTSL